MSSLVALAAPLAVEVGPGQSGPLGLLVVVLLCVACTFLFRSLRKQIRRVPRRFEPPAPSEPVTPPDGSADA